MTFQTKFWLILLLILPLLTWILRTELKGRLAKLNLLIAPGLWAQVIEGWHPRARFKRLGFWAVAMAFLALAMARPQWGEREEILGTAGLDIMVALDVSNSMNVEDVAPSRLKKSKHLLRGLAEHLGGDRIGLMVFAGGSYLAVPLTNDIEYFLENLEILNSDMVASQGTDIGIALEGAGFALSRGSEEGESSADLLKESSRAVILLSDGEDHEGRGEAAAKKLRNSGVKLFVLGVGTQKGGPVPVRDEMGQLKGYKRDQNSQPVVSKFNGSSLEKIASAGGGRYWEVSESEFETKELLSDLGLLTRTAQAERKVKVKEERFQSFLAIGLLFLVMELFIPLRRGGLAVVLMLATLGLGGCRDATDGVLSGAYLNNKDGLKALEAGETDEAIKKFNQAQAKDPWNPRVNYNQGYAKAKKGDMEGAAQSFQDAYHNAKERGDPKAAAQSAFNLGRSLQEKGDLAGAVEAYLKSIEASKEQKNKTLEDETRKNIELLIKQSEEQKKQQQQQKQEQEKQEKKDKEEKGQGNSEGSQKEKQPEEQQKEEKKDEQKPVTGVNQSKRKDFKSEKMSKEEAERVLQELGSKEKNLQNKLKKQKAKGKGTANANDW